MDGRIIRHEGVELFMDLFPGVELEGWVVLGAG